MGSKDARRATVKTPSAGGRTARSFAGHCVVMNSFRKASLFSLLAALLSTFFVTGCNTMSGVGKDVERAGEKIQQNAK
jgi:entericidin B